MAPFVPGVGRRRWVAIAVLLATAVAGCARSGALPLRVAEGEPFAEPLFSPPAAAAHDDEWLGDARTAELGVARAALARQLAVVETQLAALAATRSAAPAAAEGHEPAADPREALERQRLRLTVAIALLDGRLARRRRQLELGVPADGADAGRVVPRQPFQDASREGRPSETGRVMRDADERIDLVRQARAESKQRGYLAEITGEEHRGERELDNLSGAGADGFDFDGDVTTGVLRKVVVAKGAPATGKPPPPPPPPPPMLTPLPMPDPTPLPIARPGGTVGAAAVQPSAAPSGVVEAVRPHLGAMADCLPAEMRAGGGAALRIRALLTATGSLRQARIVSASDLPATVHACLADVLARVRAPAPPGGGGRTVTFPLWIQATD